MSMTYPVLIGEIAKRGIKKTAIAECLKISERTLYNKLTGSSSFTWNEVRTINSRFFPDMTPNDLFSTNEDTQHPE